MTYAGKINKEDALINWQQNAQEIDQKIRAFHPWPVAYTSLNEQILRIHQAQVVAMETKKTPGSVIALDKKGLLIATGKDCLLVEKIQLPGAKIIRVADWLNAAKTPISVGFIFP